MRGFATEIQGWEGRILVHSADGFFKAVIRKAPDLEDVWGWALEWNKNFRVIGLVGDLEAMLGRARRLPKLVADQDDAGNVSREEVPLAPQEDHLFELPTDDSPWV